MRSYIVKENHIGSVVSKILWYTQTDTDPVTFTSGCAQSIQGLYIRGDIWKGRKNSLQLSKVLLKTSCKGEPFRSGSQRDSSLRTKKAYYFIYQDIRRVSLPLPKYPLPTANITNKKSKHIHLSVFINIFVIKCRKIIKNVHFLSIAFL